MNVRPQYLALLVCGLVALNRGHAQEPELKPLSVKQLVQLWKQREERVKTLHAEYTETKTVMAGTQFPGPNRQPGQLFPPEETTIEVHHDLWLDGDRWRYDADGPMWTPDAGRFEPTHFVEVFDGEREVTYFGHRHPRNDAMPTAFVSILSAKTRPEWTGRGKLAVPWFLSIRNNNRSSVEGTSAAKWQLSDLEAVIDGRNCYAIERMQKAPRPMPPYRSWIDPKRGYQIVRFEHGEPPGERLSYNYRYRRHPEYGWVLSGWTRVESFTKEDGTVLVPQSSRVTVDAVTFNPQFDEDPIDFEIPPGTYVTQYSDKGTERYIARSEGARRPITEQEILRGAKYTDLLNSPSGEAKRPQRNAPWNWWLWGSVALLVIAGALLLRRRSAAG